jgi:hypothetical protein
MSRPIWQQQAQQQQRYLQQRQGGIYTLEQQRTKQSRPQRGSSDSRRSGIAGAVVGAAIGGVVAGPVGAVVGAVLGGIFSE